jgi:hypothetical protein
MWGNFDRFQIRVCPVSTHWLCHFAGLRVVVLMITPAALSLVGPVTPPPGCVPAGLSAGSIFANTNFYISTG